MTAAKGQNWADCGSAVRAFVTSIETSLRTALRANLAGLYLHGSLAMGSFYPPKSDIDLIAVVNSSLAYEVRRDIINALLRLSDQRPIIGDIEFSAVTRAAAAAPLHPMPFEAHYSWAHKEALRAGTIRHDSSARDPDLAAHLTVLRARGVALCGPEPQQMFGEVPWPNYLRSILADADEVLSGSNLAVSPIYGVLNCCRTLAALQLESGTVLNKQEGALWALANLPPPLHPLIRQALAAYRSPEPTNIKSNQDCRIIGGPWDERSLALFSEHVKTALSTYLHSSPDVRPAASLCFGAGV